VGEVRTNLDQANSWTTTSNATNDIWWKGQYWPIVRGGAEDDSSEDKVDDTEDDTSDSTSGDTDDDSSSDDTTKAKGKKFSQDEVNALVARESARAKRGKVDPKEFGFTNDKELKEFLDAAKSKEDEDKAEGEKLLEEAIKEAQADAKAEYLDVANQRVLKAEFLLAAQDYSIRKEARQDAFLVAQSLDLWEDVDIDEKGVVSGLTKQFFEDLKKAKPYFFEEPSNDDRNIGAGARGGKGGNDRETELKGKFSALRN
jgi:hypothetical protein